MKKKVVRLTEDDLVRIVKRVLKEQIVDTGDRELPEEGQKLKDCLTMALGDEEFPEECTPCFTNPNKDTCIKCYVELKKRFGVNPFATTGRVGKKATKAGGVPVFRDLMSCFKDIL